MNQWLNSMYNTVGAEEVKEASAQEAAAELELFAKVASDHGINLEELSAEEVSDLYNETMKVASEEADEDDEDEEEDEEKEAAALEEAASFEHEQQKEAAAKLAEAELMGQVMAHSFASELDSIQQAKIAKELPPALKEKAEEMKEKAKEKDEDEEKDASAIVQRGGQIVQHGGKKGMSKLKKALIAGAAGAAAAGGGAYAHKKSKEGKKEASAFDTIAAQHAIKVAEAADYDVDECIERLNAVFTLGQVEESTKVAHIADQSDATHVRSLELLETAGYPVDWEEVFGA